MKLPSSQLFCRTYTIVRVSPSAKLFRYLMRGRSPASARGKSAISSPANNIHSNTPSCPGENRSRSPCAGGPGRRSRGRGSGRRPGADGRRAWWFRTLRTTMPPTRQSQLSGEGDSANTQRTSRRRRRRRRGLERRRAVESRRRKERKKKGGEDPRSQEKKNPRRDFTTQWQRERESGTRAAAASLLAP
jgi:hypothetical protein